MTDVELRHCRRCAVEQPITNFRAHTTGRGHRRVCRACGRLERCEWRVNNRERDRAAVAGYAARHREKVRERKNKSKRAKQAYYTAYMYDYSRKNREYLNACSRAYYARNRGACIAQARLRRTRLSAAMPAWLSAIQRAQIQEFYDLAEALATQTGVPHEVDHIIPLAHGKVCGLHVPWNLQVLTVNANRRKSNRLIEAVQ